MSHLKHHHSNQIQLSVPSCDSSSLHMRWQAIRLKEIARQLSFMSDQSLFITTHFTLDQSQIIQIPEEALLLPIEMLAALAAFSWAEKMELHKTGISEVFRFVSQFLTRYNYPIDRIIDHTLSQSKTGEIPANLFPFFKQHLLRFVLAKQNGLTCQTIAKRRSRVKVNKSVFV